MVTTHDTGGGGFIIAFTDNDILCSIDCKFLLEHISSMI